MKIALLLSYRPAIALCTLALLFFCFTCPFASFASDEKPKNIVFVRYNLKDEKTSSAVLDGFKKTMTQRGYQEGKDIVYTDFHTQLPERKSADTVLNFVDKHMESADIFITTSWTSLYVRSKVARSKTPQLFSPALHSTVLSMLPSTDEPPGTNLSGVYLSFPPEKNLQLTKRLFPKARKYAYVYDSRIPADITFKAAYGQLNENERHGMTIYFLDLTSGIDTVLQRMNKMQVDAFGGAVGVLKNLKQLSKIQLPIVTNLLIDRDTNSLVELIKNSGVVAGIFSPFDNCGQQAAEMAIDILEGKKSIEEMTPQPAKQVTVINLAAAQKMNRSVPTTALEAADIVIR